MLTKLVSQVDSEFHFETAVVAHASPLEEGVYHIPNGAIDVEPPVEIPKGKRAKYNGEKWEFVKLPKNSPVVVEQKEVVSDLPKDEQVRLERTRLLDESDYVSLKYLESGLKVPREWVLYRQFLRDIPEQEGFPEKISWPTKPKKV